MIYLSLALGLSLCSAFLLYAICDAAGRADEASEELLSKLTK
jgi:hypothetical protein